MPVQPPLIEEDATGQGRLLIVDRNWVVVSQSPAGGTHAPLDTKILLRFKKVGEWLSSATMKWVAWLRHGTWTAPLDSAARLGVADSLQWVPALCRERAKNNQVVRTAQWRAL